MEETYFEEIRQDFCNQHPLVRKGKMMSSDAITYKNKVFAFFSRNKKMVFKLGKGFDPESLEIDIQIFNPFKNRGPLNGWYEVSYSDKTHWQPLANQALDLLASELA